MDIINVRSNPSFTLYLGRQGENGIRTIPFDFSSLKKEMGTGVISLVMKRKEDENPYPVSLEMHDDIAYWNISNVDTSVAGKGEAQITYSVNGRVKKTIIYKTKVDRSLLPISETPPDAYENWIDQLTDISTQAESYARQAKNSANESSLSAQNAERYADESRRYAENLHFRDDGTGNVFITIGD